MSENKFSEKAEGTAANENGADKPYRKEPPLSDLISSAKRNIEKNAAEKPPEPEEEKTIVAPNLSKAMDKMKRKTDNSGMPDIDFGKRKSAEEKPAETAKPKEQQDIQNSKDKDTQNIKSAQSDAKSENKDKDKNTQAEKKPAEAPKKQAPTPAKIPPTDKPDKPKAEQKSAAKPKQEAKKPPAKPPKSDKPEADKAKSKPAAKTEAAKSDKSDKPDKSGKAEKPAAKGKFTKKQVATVIGLIASLLLVIVLIVVLLFNHYYSLLDTDAVKVSNSKPMTYSDVDLSRADTVDKEAEDEKMRKQLAEKGEKISNSEVMNILLIGEDLRDTQNETAGNTDVMMIISVNTKDKTITMTSIMRDCYVNFQDANGWWYSTRINAAYWHGGVELTQKTIEDYMGIQIDRYVLVNFKVFIDIVDTLGGLDLKVTDEEANGYPDADPNGDNTRGMQNPLDEQNKFLGNKKGTDYIKKGGKLHLNGNQALAYARLRHIGNADYERTERQRKVIKQMIKKSRSLSLVEMDKLANKIFPQIKTNVTKTELAQLLLDMLDYRNYELQEMRVPADNTFTNQVISGMDVLSVDFNANAQLFKELVYGTVEVSDNGEEQKQTIE